MQNHVIPIHYSSLWAHTGTRSELYLEMPHWGTVGMTFALQSRGAVCSRWRAYREGKCPMPSGCASYVRGTTSMN